jgi:hypothetical protein
VGNTDTAQAAPARAALKRPARTPKALQKRKLTLQAAIDQWCETTLAIEGLQALRKEAADVLLDNAERTGRRTFKDRIAVVRSGGSLILDQTKVRELLGARLPDFQTRTKLGWTLKLLR